MKTVFVQPLNREAFLPFGDVIETEGSHSYPINNGTTIRHHDLARVETLGQGARTLISIFRGDRFELPVRIAMVERHPLGSQAFIPMEGRPFLVVVAPDLDGVPGEPLAFLARGNQGVNYHRNVWHHPLLALEARSDFLVVDRGGDGNNLEEYSYPEPFSARSLT